MGGGERLQNMRGIVMTSALIPETWDQSYREWFASHQDALEARDWKKAFDGYPWIAGSDLDRSLLKKPVSAACIALISSGGVSRTDQVPFDAVDPLGDATFRAIEGSLGAWHVNHGHYDTAAAEEDFNTVFPLEALEELARRGVIGAVAPINYTFMGYQPDPRPFFETSAPKILQGLQANDVDGVLLVPG